jgi:hypothetical protein
MQSAMKIAGLSFTADEHNARWKLNGARGYLAGYERLRTANLGDTQPAIVFNPVPPGKRLPTERRPLRRQPIDVSTPGSDEALAFHRARYALRQFYAALTNASPSNRRRLTGSLAEFKKDFGLR